MDSIQFRVPVRIQRATGDVITEIYSAEEALDFLLAWPQQSGPIFETAVSECLAAAVAVESAAEAQRAFVAFARVSGVLSKDMALPEAVRNQASVGIAN